MTKHSMRFHRAMEGARAAVTAALCVLMVTPPAVAATGDGPGSGPTIPGPVQTKPLTQEQRVLHELNRLTFGPRPGDEAAVENMGVEMWFQRQLHPEKIDDSAFEARLAQFPALKLSVGELMEKYPTPQMIRQIVKNGGGAPSGDPAEKAIYANSIAQYKLRIANGGQDPQLKPVGGSAMPDMVGGQDTTPSMQDDAAMKPGDALAAGPAQAGAAPGVALKGKGKKSGATIVPLPEEQVEALLAMPADERMTKILAMSPQGMMSLRVSLKPYQVQMLAAGMSPQQRETLGALRNPTQMVGAEALEARIERDVYSERQLQAVMDDFWLNHFSVYAKKNQNEPYYLASYERDTILPRSLGKFENLLVATAESPAMLMYLDNWQSVGPDSPAAQRGQRVQQYADRNPNRAGVQQIAQFLPKGINENYARELMELHTLGVRCEVSKDHPASALAPDCGSGYTQADVTNVAKVLTGWTIDRAYSGGSKFVFDESKHEGGSKVVLGKTIKEGDWHEGMEVLHMLATSPATAHFVSQKLAVRFVSDTPPAALVNRMADTWIKTDGDIKSVLTAMFHSPEFWAPSVYRAKVKTPIEFVASALRASDATVANPIALVAAMNQLGMPIYGMQTPNGYSWQADQWVSSNALVSRMNFALVLSGSRVPGARTNWPRLLGDTGGTAVATAPGADTELKLETLILGQPAAPRTRATVLDQFKNPTAQTEAEQKLGLKPDADDDDGNSPAMMRAAYSKRKGGGGRGQGMQANQPETPLDTMAGLLLGSPDFQRR